MILNYFSMRTNFCRLGSSFVFSNLQNTIAYLKLHGIKLLLLKKPVHIRTTFVAENFPTEVSNWFTKDGILRRQNKK